MRWWSRENKDGEKRLKKEYSSSVNLIVDQVGFKMASGTRDGKTILLKAILLGDGGVGKSCLMDRFVSNRYDPTSFHTIGVEFLNKEIGVNGQSYTIQVRMGRAGVVGCDSIHYQCVLSNTDMGHGRTREIQEFEDTFLSWIGYVPLNLCS